MESHKSNIILIGMAGCGKSSVGKMLADMLGRPFVDTDDLIVRDRNRPLQEIIDSEGPMGFRRIEEMVLLNMNCKSHVIATGGSSIYSAKGLDHLNRTGVVILLDARLDVLKERVGDTSGRGLVKEPDQSFAELYEERKPLYERYGSIVIDTSDLPLNEVCRRIIAQLQLEPTK